MNVAFLRKIYKDGSKKEYITSMSRKEFERFNAQFKTFDGFDYVPMTEEEKEKQN